MSSETITIDLDDESDRWRYVCPNAKPPRPGHRSWEAVNFHFWCSECAAATAHNDGVDPEFDELLDLKTGETIPRERVELVGSGYQAHRAGGRRAAGH